MIAPARAAAFEILLKVATTDAHSDELLRGRNVDALSAQDRALATTLVLGAASAWWALSDWSARRHYLLGTAAAACTAIAVIAFPGSPIRAFTWLVMTTSASVAVETCIDYRALRRSVDDGGEGEVHVDAV